MTSVSLVWTSELPLTVMKREGYYLDSGESTPRYWAPNLTDVHGRVKM